MLRLLAAMCRRLSAYVPLATVSLSCGRRRLGLCTERLECRPLFGMADVRELVLSMTGCVDCDYAAERFLTFVYCGLCGTPRDRTAACWCSVVFGHVTPC